MQTQDNSQAASTADSGERAEVVQTGFGSRGRARRRVRFLRKARELAYRDLGGLVFNLHRFGQRNDALVLAKLTTLGHIDGELRTIEAALGEREPVTVLREAGITACPRCAAIGSKRRSLLPQLRAVDEPSRRSPRGGRRVRPKRSHARRPHPTSRERPRSSCLSYAPAEHSCLRCAYACPRRATPCRDTHAGPRSQAGR